MKFSPRLFFFFCSFSCNTHIHHWPPTFFYALEPHLECSRVHALIILDKKSEISKRRGDKEEKGRRGKTLLYVHKTGEQEKKERKERKMIENRNDDWKKRMEDYFRYERIAKIWKISKKKQLLFAVRIQIEWIVKKRIYYRIRGQKARSIFR